MIPANLLAPTYIQMLTALSGWLEKAEAATSPGDQSAAPLRDRLADDMFPLGTQIRFACVQALEGMYRLRNEPFPDIITELLDEGRNAMEEPGTMAHAQRRIRETVSSVRSLAETTDDLDPKTPVAHALPKDMIFDLTLEHYARDWAVPQFYFT